jgi:[calcium/calmodulin-dependent protein kinase] kinase
MFKGDDRIKKAGGSPAFLSPESFTCESSTFPGELWPDRPSASPADIHGKAVDIWALGELTDASVICASAHRAPGVTLYCLLTGVLPFNVENPIDLFEVVKTKELVLHIILHCHMDANTDHVSRPVLKDEWSPELKDLLSSMLDKNPDTRSVMEDIRVRSSTSSQ